MEIGLPIALLSCELERLHRVYLQRNFGDRKECTQSFLCAFFP
jgi:hypothetical protein